MSDEGKTGGGKPELVFRFFDSDSVDEWFPDLRLGLQEALDNSHNLLTAEYLKLQVSRRTLSVIGMIIKRGDLETLAGFYFLEEILDSHECPGVNVPILWTDPKVCQRNGAGFSETDVVREALDGLQSLVLAVGGKVIKFYSSRRGYEKMAPIWGFERRMVEWVKHL